MAAHGLSYWPADASVGVAESTVGGVLVEAAALDSQRVAMVAYHPSNGTRRSWTFGELLAESRRTAAALLQRFEPGERVAVWAPNLPEWVILEFGAALAGLVLVTVNPAYRSAELSYVLNQSGASGIFYTPQFRSPMGEYLAQIRPEVPKLRDAVAFTQWHDFVSSGRGDVALPEVRPDDLAQIQYTSGTTGFPKGAELHHRGLTNNARFYAERIQLGTGEVYVNPMPLFHTAGCSMGVLGSVQRGAVHVPVYTFDPAVVIDLIEREGANAICGVPTMLIAMLDHPDLAARDTSSLRVVVSGGAPVPADLVRRTESRLAVTVSVVFGTTECSPLLTQVRLDDRPEDRAETLGRALPQTEIKVTDVLTGEPVPLGEPGELCARGYLVMRGYHDAPNATASAIDPDGWYHTGDIASMDERGFLRIEGRLKDMIIRGGENIYPREIEELLFAHPAVAEVAVVGVPDEQWGEVVAAVIRLHEGASVDRDELRAYSREQLAAYKAPVIWEFVEQFPLTASGKIQKFKLREALEARQRLATT